MLRMTLGQVKVQEVSVVFIFYTYVILDEIRECKRGPDIA